uniref:Uncharacterized protein n=1 Tax=Physcomitrium patens TaxID=3218 RepID=A0A2K1KET3_PHYPA|nr:hypothetical protein PHYPA_008633 [Physcomitrium patens]
MRLPTMCMTEPLSETRSERRMLFCNSVLPSDTRRTAFSKAWHRRTPLPTSSLLLSACRILGVFAAHDVSSSIPFSMLVMVHLILDQNVSRAGS